MITQISRDGQIYAIIVSSRFQKAGIEFFSPGDFSQQLGYMSHPAGKTIDPHTHNLVHREVTLTQEVLFIKKGKLRVDFYDEAQKYFESRVLESGDVILLAKGGHGFEVLEDLQMFEVKQGPYAGEEDKIRFKGVPREQLKIAKP